MPKTIYSPSPPHELALPALHACRLFRVPYQHFTGEVLQIVVSLNAGISVPFEHLDSQGVMDSGSCSSGQKQWQARGRVRWQGWTVHPHLAANQVILITVGSILKQVAAIVRILTNIGINGYEVSYVTTFRKWVGGSTFIPVGNVSVEVFESESKPLPPGNACDDCSAVWHSNGIISHMEDIDWERSTIDVVSIWYRFAFLVHYFSFSF